MPENFNHQTERPKKNASSQPKEGVTENDDNIKYRKILVDLLKNGNGYTFTQLINNPELAIDPETIRNAKIQALSDLLKNEGIYTLIELLNNSGLAIDPAIVHTLVETMGGWKMILSNLLINKKVDDFAQLVNNKKLAIDSAIVHTCVETTVGWKKVLSDILKNKDTFPFTQLVNNPKLAIDPETIRNAKIRALSDLLKSGKVDEFTQLVNSSELAINKTILASPEVQDGWKEHLSYLLRNRNVDEFAQLVTNPKLAIDESTLASPEVQDGWKKCLSNLLKGEWLGGFIKLVTNPKLAIDESTLASPEVQDGWKKCLSDLLKRNDEPSFTQLINNPELAIDPETIRNAKIETLSNILKNRKINDFTQLVNNSALAIDPETIRNAKIQALSNLLKHGKDDDFTELVTNQKLAIDETILISPEIQHPATEYFLESEDGEASRKIAVLCHLDIQSIANKLLQTNPRGFFKQYAMKKFEGAHIDPVALKERYQSEIEAIKKTDPEVKANLEELHTVLGVSRSERMLLGSLSFWNNPHDTLLFMNTFRSRNETDRININRIVFSRLLVPGVDFSELNTLLGSFDVNLYMQERGGDPFSTADAFRREVLMQKNNIKIPATASEEFQYAIGELIKAPGVDVPFIRRMIDDYAAMQKSAPPKNENSFSQRLIAIIEGEDAIDDRQIIQPYETEINFDPVHKVLLALIGIRDLNQQSAKIHDLFGNSEQLRSIVQFLQSKDAETIAHLQTERDANKQKYPEKAGHYDAEFNKSVKKSTLFELGTGGSLNALLLANRDSYKENISQEEIQFLSRQLYDAFTQNTLFRESMTRIVSALVNTEKREMVDGYLDVNAEFFTKHVSDIRDVFEEIKQARIAEFASAQDSKQKALLLQSWAEECARRYFESLVRSKSEETNEQRDENKPDALSMTEFLLMLGLNNRNRQATSLSLMNILTQTIHSKSKKEKYSQLAQQEGERDAIQAYLKGKLILDKEDEDTLREVYQKEIKSIPVRKLGVEIVKKSDPRGWVCGDYTDCCMRFTSSKNQEYVLREDMAYFLVSAIDIQGNKTVIAQSVLVYGEDASQITIAIDNMEIAKKSVERGERAIIAQAYHNLKQSLVETYGKKGKRLKIVIGTSYNDDGGLITGECELLKRDAKPLRGDMEYSDWYRHSSNYVFYDSQAEHKEQRYYGLSIDSWENSRSRRYIQEKTSSIELRREEEKSVKALLEKIGHGEDDNDGDGGQTFPDNYSALIEKNEKPIGYVLAADYLVEEHEKDYVHFERMRLDNSLSEDTKKSVFEQYLSDKGLLKRKKIDGFVLHTDFLEQNAFVEECFRKLFPEAVFRKEGDALFVEFAKKR